MVHRKAVCSCVDLLSRSDHMHQNNTHHDNAVCFVSSPVSGCELWAPGHSMGNPISNYTAECQRIKTEPFSG